MSTYNFRRPILAKVYSRPIVSSYFVSRYDTRVVRYTGSLQVAPNQAPVVDSVIATPNTLTITFNTAIVLTGAAAFTSAWTITGPGSPMVINVTVLGIEVVANVVTLNTSEQTGGAVYTLNLPSGLIFSTPGGLGFTGPFQQSFTGSPTSTPLISAVSIDAQTLDILFLRAVQPGDATNPANYALSPSVAVLSVVQLSPNGFRLTTAPQSSDQAYLLTASNIRDLAFNPI